MASPQAKSNAMLTLLTLPGTHMTPEVQARYCQLAMDPYPDHIVIQAAEEAALTLERRPTPGEFRTIAQQLLKQSQLQTQTQHEEPVYTPEQAAQDAIDAFKATNPDPQDLNEFIALITNALQTHNYPRIAYLLWGQHQALTTLRRRLKTKQTNLTPLTP